MKLKIVLIVGDSLRHKHYANTISKNFPIAGIVVQERDLIPENPNFLNKDDEDLFNSHFFKRNSKERFYFKEKNFLLQKKTEILEVTKENLNSKMTIDFVKSLKPNLVLVYGTHLFKELLSVCPKYTINLHGGLSPWYRGSATLFYPTYFMQPQYSGMTFHLINKRIDNGQIIQHCRPVIFETDKIHDVGCKAVLVASEIVIKLVEKFKKDGELKLFPQTSRGKIFYDKDFAPQHLRVIEMLEDQEFYKEYLNNKEKFIEPKLINQI